MDNEVNEHGQTYSQWLDAIDKIMLANFGITSSDAVDAPYRDNFLDGVSPLDMVYEIGEWDEIVGAFIAEHGITV